MSLSKPGGLVAAIAVLLSLWCAPRCAAAEGASLKERYTYAHPLVYEDAWDMPPYSFLDKAEAKGLNIDVVGAILHRLDIPFVVKLRPTEEVLHDFMRGEAGLSIGIYSARPSLQRFYGQASLGLYTYAVLHPKNVTIDTDNLNNLRYQRISVPKFSYCYQDLVRRGFKDNITITDDIYDAIHRVDATDSGVVINVMATLQFVIDKYKLQNVNITPISVNGGDLRFMSPDGELLFKMDSVFSVMKAGEDLVAMQRRWFFPDLQPEEGTPYAAIALWATAALLALALLGVAVYRRREREASRDARHTLRRLTTYLQGNNLYIWTYDSRHDTYTVLFDPMGETNETHSGGEYRDLFSPDDYLLLSEAIKDVDSGNAKLRKLTLRPAIGTRVFYDVRIIRIHSSGRRSDDITLGIFQNIGAAGARAEELHEATLRYQNVLDAVNTYQTGATHTVFDIDSQKRMIERNVVRRQQYISDVKRALNNRDVKIFTYHPNRHVLDIVDTEGEVSGEMSQLQAIRFIARRSRRMVSTLVRSLDDYSQDVFSVVLRTRLRDSQGRQIYYRATGIPICDSQGVRTHYFGFIRDITDQQEAQAKLEAEMRKAAEAERVKIAFMRNISYEVRTPLSSVIGFAELFAGEHDEADEQLFMQQIRDNSAVLLSLVNDILRLSRLDAGMIELQPMEVNFADIFASLCQSGWEQHQKEGVTTLVEDRFNTLNLEIDIQQMSSIIELAAAHSAYFTDKGVLQASYEYIHGNLIMLFEDTSARMTQTLPDSMLLGVESGEDLDICGQRLKLQICAKLAKIMGGKLEISVRSGKGSTTTITIPCKAGETDRKVGHARQGKEDRQ